MTDTNWVSLIKIRQLKTLNFYKNTFEYLLQTQIFKRSDGILHWCIAIILLHITIKDTQVTRRPTQHSTPM